MIIAIMENKAKNKYNFFLNFFLLSNLTLLSNIFILVVLILSVSKYFFEFILLSILLFNLSIFFTQTFKQSFAYFTTK